MFISQNREHEWLWYSNVVSKDANNKEVKHSINITFKKGCEPKDDELNEYGCLVGDLYFIDNQGRKRRVFPIAKEYKDRKYIEFKLLDVEGAVKYDEGFKSDEYLTSLNEDDDSKISPDDLPFY